MYNNSQELKNENDELDFPSSIKGNLDISPELPTIPPRIPFLSIIENKTKEGHERDQQQYDIEQQMNWRIPKLKKEKTQDENETRFIPNDFPSTLSNFTGTFDVNAIPGLMPPADIPGQLNSSPFDLAPFKIPPTTRVTRSGGRITPIDVRTLFGNRPGKLKTDVREPANIRGPVDIRNMPPNQFNNLIWGSDSRFGARGAGMKGTKKEKSLAGLPAKQQEFEVSKRLSKLEKLIQMDESEMTEKQRSEKVRLLRLEKNRRAAAVSRERKKRYIRSLEERSLIMSRHLEALELENGKLRELLSQNNITNPNILNPALPNLPNLELSPTKQIEARKRPFSAMMDMNFPGMSDASEGAGCEKLALKMNDAAIVQTTANKTENKRMRAETSNGGLESMDIW